MRTASTKQQRDRKRAQSGSTLTPAATARECGIERESGIDQNLSERWWWIASLLVMLAAVIFRFVMIELKPLHHDEGVNGFFLTRLVREGVYQYDPSNYHGPTLYYFALPSSLIFGLNIFAIRSVTALFGVATILLILCLRRRIGSIGALAAAALIAVSPGAVYLSRYFIHETLFVFFTLGLVVAALRFYETTRAVYLLLSSASVALLFATKETAFISVIVLLLAMGVAWAVVRLAHSLGWAIGPAREEKENARGRKVKFNEESSDQTDALLARFGGTRRLTFLLMSALALFVVINLLFYSSFLTYAKGVEGAIESLKIWTKTGTSDFHRKPVGKYVEWLLQEESPVLLLGIIGAIWAVLRARNRFAIFVAAWAFGILAAYSLVPYKTPWLALNFIIPLAIIGGYGVNECYNWSKLHAPPLGAGVLAATSLALLFGTYQSIQLNFFHYDDYDGDKYPYVYAHTRRELLDLINEVEKLAARTDTGRKTSIAVISPDYWPLPWYLRDYDHIGYHAQIGSRNEPIIIANESQEPQLQSLLGENYKKIGDSYALRPSVNLVLYAHRNLAE